MIRQLTDIDLNALLKLYEHLHSEENNLSPETINNIWAQSGQNKNIFYFGYFVGDQLVSSCQLVLIANFTRQGKPYCLIENVVTHEDYRRMGFGKKLLKFTLNYAWQQDCYKAMLMTGRQDEYVHQFYKDLGFKHDEKTAYIAKPNQ